MAGKGSKKHIHKYHRVLIADNYVWACAFDDCTHYMPKHMESMVVGKATFCWNCDEKTVMSPVNMNDDKPLCVKCVTGSTASDIVEDNMSALIRQMLQSKDARVP